MYNASAYDFSAMAPSGQTLYYNIVDGNAEIVRPSNNNYISGNLIIPSTVSNNGVNYTVSAIGAYSFQYTSITSITLPNTITSVGYLAFYGCNNLTKTNYTGTITDWCNISFSTSSIEANPCCLSHNLYINDTLVTDLIIPEGVTELKFACFYNCSNITSISLPSTLTSIGSAAFEGCSGLSSIIIPNSVNLIEDFAFKNCTGLVHVEIPSSVHSISNDVFYGCCGLISVVLPSTISSFGVHVFCYCNSLTEIILKAPTPPSIVSTTFVNMPSGVVFKIPCESIQSYTNSWGNTYIFQCFYTLNYNLTINSNDSIWGTGSYTALGDSTAEVTATANYGYHFDHWSYGSTANPDTLLLSSDVTITAIFAKNQYSVTGTANDNTKGTVTGSATVDYLDSVTLTATANYGYHFLRWSDYHSENPRKVAATGNIDLTAIFDFNQYTITLSVDNSIHGTTSGAGEYNYLSERTIRANANYGYHFTQWNDGDTDNPRTITLTQDTSFMALFAKNTYTLTVSSNDTTLGSVVGGGTYEYLDTIAISATAIEHCHFVRWVDGNTLNPRNVIMTSDISRSAIFAIDTHSVTIQVGNIAHGTYSGNGQYQYGSAATVEALPYSGYQFTHWSNGSTYNPYTFAVLQDSSLTAFFVADGEPWQDTVVLYDTINVDVHDTTYIPYAVHDTTYIDVHDTTYIDVHDTTYIDVPYPVHDTTIVHDTTFVDIPYPVHDTTYIDVPYPVHDTTVVTDTIWLTLYDTVWLHDTIVVHDTIYITQEGVDGAEAVNAKVYASQGQIVVEGAESNTVTLYDVRGRILATKRDDSTSLRFDAPASGTYMIKIGSHAARKVVVIR